MKPYALTIKVYKIDSAGRRHGERAPVAYLPRESDPPQIGGFPLCGCKRCRALRANGQPDLVEQAEQARRAAR